MNRKANIAKYEQALDLSSAYFGQIRSIINLGYNELISKDERAIVALLDSALIICEKAENYCDAIIEETN